MSLDFEKPIIELEEKLNQMKDIAAKNGKSLDDEAVLLEDKINELKKEIFSNLTRWQKVQLSRHPKRPYFLDYIYKITNDFIELHGDRVAKDDKAMVGGIADIDGKSVVIIGQQKGRTTKDRQFRNFGMSNPDGYRKALRLMRIAEKFKMPVVTLIDTPGAYPGLEAEERGQAEAIARNIQEMATLKVPVICIVIGEGASGGALGIGVGDKVYMMEYTWYSVISPESCSSILWRSWDYKEQAAEALKLTSSDLKKMKIIDGVIKEPLGGAHNDIDLAAKRLKKVIIDDIKSLEKIKPDKRIDERINKFSQMGIIND
ncbi:MAG: acetyl-CoA carboxylase carboxyltransferase subunit alpha [Cytophagales bacterium]|nr:MAG: acetyl-CoA carboxylase carboxyl transferase subunit alpha [Rhodothermaeota bacterium MED-G18]|tara:strand:+ start:156 stop:1103 length:948 start_codon:yes stop_codon:yes gene_type:complete